MKAIFLLEDGEGLVLILESGVDLVCLKVIGRITYAENCRQAVALHLGEEGHHLIHSEIIYLGGAQTPFVDFQHHASNGYGSVHIGEVVAVKAASPGGLGIAAHDEYHRGFLNEGHRYSRPNLHQRRQWRDSGVRVRRERGCKAVGFRGSL